MPEQPDEERLYVWNVATRFGRPFRRSWRSGFITLPFRSVARQQERSIARSSNTQSAPHYYSRTPSAAVADAKSTPNLLNRVIHAQAIHGKAGPAVKFFRQLIPVGTAAKQPRTRDMIKALVLNLTTDAARSNVVLDQLDDEYALSSAFAHGSQAMFVDVFHGPTNEIFPRTRSLTRVDELLRAITCLIAFLSALRNYLWRRLWPRRTCCCATCTGPIRRDDNDCTKEWPAESVGHRLRAIGCCTDARARAYEKR